MSIECDGKVEALARTTAPRSFYSVQIVNTDQQDLNNSALHADYVHRLLHPIASGTLVEMQSMQRFGSGPAIPVSFFLPTFPGLITMEFFHACETICPASSGEAHRKILMGMELGFDRVPQLRLRWSLLLGICSGPRRQSF
jgi:hypothetical protein